MLMSGKQCYYLEIDHLYHTTYITSIRKNFWKNGMICFDAHADYCDDDSKYDHGVMILHTFNEKLIDSAHSIRNWYSYRT
ncbi:MULTISPECIES: arginase family protein [unclassified Candidatus Blochmanniella]|uniref:arginase family protein n=1 Tax=unclassified Candidatus Blochmanniella TaxID=711328 RepID=UPI002A4E142E|nr:MULTISPECIES: arginase family protein [unclassified Candidatus Blochmannia]